MGLAYAFWRVLVGIPGGGYVFDRTGSYEIVLAATAIGCLISVGLSLMVQPARYHAESCGKKGSAREAFSTVGPRGGRPRPLRKSG